MRLEKVGPECINAKISRVSPDSKIPNYTGTLIF
jgi:hypothetical protein